MTHLNRWFKFGLAIAIFTLIGLIIGVFLPVNVFMNSGKNVGDTVSTEADSEENQFVTSVKLMSGTAPVARGEFERGTPLGVDSAIDLPITAAEAVVGGWKDPVLCSIGRGRFFQKGLVGEGEPYFLMYDAVDRLIGIYQYSEFEMPPPWEKHDQLSGGGGLTIIDYPHWSLVIYFRDPVKACKTEEGAGVLSGYFPGDGGKVRSTPTPVLIATPTPTAGKVVEMAVIKTSKLKALSFEVTGDPKAKKIEGTLNRSGVLTLVNEGVVTVTDNSGNTEVLNEGILSFTFNGLGATLSGIAAALQDPVDAKSAYINNLKRRGVSGTVLGSDLTGLIPTAVADASVTVTLWIDERSRIVRLQVEGAVISDDATDIVRVFNIGSL